MKILFTFYNPSGGMETLNRIRSDALMKKHIECCLLYTNDGAGLQNIKNIRTYITNENEVIKRILERECFDMIIVCTDIDLLERIATMNYKGHLIYEIQGLGTLTTAECLIKDFSTRIEKYADGIVFPQTAHLKHLIETYCPTIRKFCFDNPLDTEVFGYTSYPPKEYPIIGWVGRIEANKNWREFLEIGWRLRKINPTIRLWMFEDATLFDADEKMDFEKSPHRQEVSSHLIRYSNVPHEQMADYFSIIGDSGGFLCSTSITEGFGYAVAEAMLSRCPVLSTDSDGIRRFLFHNRTGKMYQQGNIDQAVEEAEQLMLNLSLRKAIRRRSQSHIRQQFSTFRYCNNFLDMATVVMASPSRTFERDNGLNSHELR
ncbi:glycosyltransferase family 4 protein [Paenibacillus sp. CMAA1364]